jgi:hypothetical protein
VISYHQQCAPSILSLTFPKRNLFYLHTLKLCNLSRVFGLRSASAALPVPPPRHCRWHRHCRPRLSGTAAGGVGSSDGPGGGVRATAPFSSPRVPLLPHIAPADAAAVPALYRRPVPFLLPWTAGIGQAPPSSMASSSG